MTIDPTHLTTVTTSDYPTVGFANGLIDAVNDLKDNAADKTAGLFTADNLELNTDKASIAESGIKFWLGGSSAFARFLYDKGAGYFKLLNNSSVLQALSLADGTDATHAVTLAQLDALSDSTDTAIDTLDASVTALLASQIFQKQYLPSAQTITPAGSLTLAHGLGLQPKLVTYHLVNQTAEFGYSVGDEVDLSVQFPPSNSNYGVAVVADATNINVRFGSATIVFLLLDKSNGNAINIHPANWGFVMRAYA